MLLVPSIYLMLAQFPISNQYDLSSVRSWASGGSSLPPRWCSSTASGHHHPAGLRHDRNRADGVHHRRENAVRKAGSVGKPVLHTDVCIMDRTATCWDRTKVGELCIRGGNVTTGYWNRRKPRPRRS
jgi:fatty-acyl-CoA synthase